MFMGLLAVYVVLLARYSSEEHVVCGLPHAGRNRAEVEGTTYLTSRVGSNSKRVSTKRRSKFLVVCHIRAIDFQLDVVLAGRKLLSI